MKPIFVSFAKRIDRAGNLRKAFEFAQIEFSSFTKIGHAENGKPFLVLDQPRNIGYSLSHSHEVEVIALLDEERELGVDLELWPHRTVDPVFWDSVASPEDDRILKMLGQTGQDAGIAVWVIKEAALKCSGDVMTDPRDLSVTHLAKNIFRVKSSAKARSPHPEIDVSLLNRPEENTLLLGIAMSADALRCGRKLRPVHFNVTGWKVAEFGK